ncbi:cryptochrome/photolyase family protein [Sulfurimonas microaerophilic]|uniref:cryptochrome/photolyase family protein n=1 Tax=Sulfurimonas microaerophilic TaxID=3058392 RepID=UPI00271553C4|nr:deoxyribodipyrimidine photo-lyase [Sulfurimonas sp. hsl 1-7]
MKRILWFRRDLRVRDNKLLSYTGEVLPIFIFDKHILDKLEKDDKRVTLIYDYVFELKKELQALGLDLKIFYDFPEDVFEKLLKEYDFDEVVASGDYDSYAKQRDLTISHKIHFRYLNETYLFKSKEILKKDGTPYLLFTPFYKVAMERLKSKDLTEVKIGSMQLLSYNYEDTPSLSDMGFVKQNITLPKARQKLEDFKKKLADYKTQRDFPSLNGTSELSVSIRFGVLGIREIVRELFAIQGSYDFIRELIFREFYAYLLFHFPSLETQNFKYTFQGIKDSQKFEKFVNAKTGVPFIDAGVRELLTKGKMHNRVRMVVASFFTKDLLLPWQMGEAFFAKYLLDYDKASNVLSWQWSAGTGVDPQPYFRVFNPYLQSKKFDKDVIYIKKYLPELQEIPSKYLHDEHYLLSNDIPNYPKPMVVHKEAAKRAIELFKH